MTEKFYSVEDVMQILGISKSAAYKIMRQMNDELKKKRLCNHSWQGKQKIF